MSYITTQDLIDRFGNDELLQVASLPEDANTIDDTRIQQAIDDACAEVDSILSMRFVTPLTEVPSIVGRSAADIARYFLHDDATSEEIQTRYKDAIATLKEIANGTRGVSPLPEEANPSTDTGTIGYSARRSGADRVFTRESLEGF